MKSEVTIVTAFFDIGRANASKDFARSNDKYLNYFKFWARVHNNLIVYTDHIMAEEVKKVRKEFGLEGKTKIVVIDNYASIEPEILEREKKIAESETFLKYRYMPNPMDNNPAYDHIMLLKSWCINDAVENQKAEGLLMWLDFGFNHGGDVFNNPLDFDTVIKMNVPQDKITVFSFKEDDNKPIFQIVQSYEVYIMGAPMCVPASLANMLWKDMKNAMNSLLDVGFIDDDQTLLLMAVRNNRENYNLIKSTWFMPLKDYGIENLSIITEKPKPYWKDTLLEGYRVNKRNRKCIKNLKTIFLKNRDR